MRIFAILFAAAALNAAAAPDALAQRGLLKAGLVPPIYGANGRIACCSAHYAALGNSCSAYYQACMDGYGLHGRGAKGLHDCGAARAVCLRTGVWDTRRYGPNGRYLASIERR